METNSSMDDWVSDCQTLASAVWAEAELVAGGYFSSSASKHFTRILPQRQARTRRGGEIDSLGSTQAVTRGCLLTDVSKRLVYRRPESLRRIFVVHFSLSIVTVSNLWARDKWVLTRNAKRTARAIGVLRSLLNHFSRLRMSSRRRTVM